MDYDEIHPVPGGFSSEVGGTGSGEPEEAAVAPPVPEQVEEQERESGDESGDPFSTDLQAIHTRLQMQIVENLTTLQTGQVDVENRMLTFCVACGDPRHAVNDCPNTQPASIVRQGLEIMLNSMLDYPKRNSATRMDTGSGQPGTPQRTAMDVDDGASNASSGHRPRAKARPRPGRTVAPSQWRLIMYDNHHLLAHDIGNRRGKWLVCGVEISEEGPQDEQKAFDLINERASHRDRRLPQRGDTPKYPDNSAYRCMGERVRGGIDETLHPCPLYKQCVVTFSPDPLAPLLGSTAASLASLEAIKARVTELHLEQLLQRECPSGRSAEGWQNILSTAQLSLEANLASLETTQQVWDFAHRCLKDSHLKEVFRFFAVDDVCEEAIPEALIQTQFLRQTSASCSSEIWKLSAAFSELQAPPGQPIDVQGPEPRRTFGANLCLNSCKETDEELTGPSGATASAHGIGPAPFAQPAPTNPFQPTSPANAGTEIAMTAADLRLPAAQAAAFASTAQGSRPMGVGDLTKVLPKPDPFRPTTRDEEFAQWTQWSWTFEQYLSCLEPEFSSELRDYGRQQTAVILSSLDESAKRRSRLLYGMLNGLLYERGRRLLRSVQEQNGFEAWRLLSKDLMPKTRNRVLALLRTINSWPSFAAQQGLAQQLLRLESAFEEYERLEPGGLPENNKMATLLSCLTRQLRQHANVVVSDDSSYSDLRELVLRWDGANTKWHKWQTSVASSYGLSDGKKGLHDTGDVAPMEVDRVNAKGDKGKAGKGRPKGKGDKGKDGKGKAKGSKGDAGKGDKGKGKGGKDKGGHPKGNWPSVCSWCQKPGHYKRDCFQLKAYMQGHQKGARQVQANSSAASDAGTSTTAPSSASALQAQQGKAGQSTVRRVAAEPLLFDMSDLEDPLPYEPNVCMVTVIAPQSYAMDAQGDDGQWTLPPDDYAVLDLVPLMFKGYSLAVNAQICRVEREEPDLMHYNPGAGEVNNHSDDEASEGELHAGLRQSDSQQVRDANSQQQVRDANSQQVRDADSQQVRDADSQQVRDADSQQVRDADSQQVCDAACSQSQLQVTGEVREVCPSKLHVASIQVRFEAKTLESLDFGWQVSSSGHLVWRGRASRFVGPSFMAPIGWPLRSTLICRSGTWFLLEHCVPWADLKEVEAVLPGGQVAEVISFLHVQVEPVSEIGVQLPAGMTEPQGLPEPDFYHFRAETEQAPVGTVEHDRVVLEDEAMQGLEDAAGQSSPAPMALPDQLEAGVPAGNVEPLTLDGVLMSHDSSLAVLKTAAAKLNLSTAGSKSRLFNRVKGYLEKQRLALELELAADAQSSGERQPRVQPVAAAPAEAERFLHERTHVPFKPWCPHCTSMRAMPDRSEYLKEGPRDNPIIQFDFSFSGYSVPGGICNLDAAPEDSQRALKCLVAHDSATGMIAAIPCESKGDTRYLGIELMRFIQSLGHTTVTLKCDNEPSTLTLQRAIVTARQRLGLQTLVQNPAIGAKGSLGFCEKAIDSVRKLANTLLDQARHRTGLSLPTTHVLFAWAFVHSAWLLNRYRVIGNMTAYERACGAKYSGRIAPFAEPVYFQLDVKQKGDKRWMLGILVSKSSLNDMYIIAGKDGIRLSRSIRRVGQPWELEVQLYRELKGYPWGYGSGVIGTKFVLLWTQSPDEAASEPPTPAVEALGMPVTPLGRAGAMAPPRRNVPPPESARAIPDESMAGVEAEPPGPNPAMRPDPPSTPEAELPPLKKLRIRAVTFGEQSYEVNDEGEFDLDQPDGWEVQTKLWSMESETDDSFTNEFKADPEAEVAEDDDRLWFPDNGREPELDDAILAELDNLGDQVEVSRLLKKSVLRHATSDDDLASMKSLTTKFVRTWRRKKRNGNPSWYRRSRLCAREFRWLDESKEGLFSPATSTDIVRLIPAQWLAWKQTRPSEQYAILALDVKDAYLEVPQPTPVVSKVQGQDLVFMRMVPGQREGSQQWFSHFCEYLGEHFVVENCKECPAVVHVSSKPGSDGVCADKGPGMIHVDDSLLLLPLPGARECLLPVIEQRFQITYELAYEVGHSFSFLKREHTITDQGIVICQPSSYIEQMKQTMNVTQNNRQRVDHP
ncbi:GIP [Symbiodinium sp. CCMP2592]|nr:GIP [Symbiodinium sp. CCMP2592]